MGHRHEKEPAWAQAGVAQATREVLEQVEVAREEAREEEKRQRTPRP